MIGYAPECERLRYGILKFVSEKNWKLVNLPLYIRAKIGYNGIVQEISISGRTK